ncbi:hypothetical protein EUGRSUZ_F00739 [Eucalyptus grandis]|uniref:Uncharacterized protein n=2 Tax=Eucalyptus grandis TaxID=71139 RepID=A0ACC3KC92_EUCGR|nr:hypothetical protein EUGRSUZ_F00739 [Eucalyptus grandis]
MHAGQSARGRTFVRHRACIVAESADLRKSHLVNLTSKDGFECYDGPMVSIFMVFEWLVQCGFQHKILEIYSISSTKVLEKEHYLVSEEKLYALEFKLSENYYVHLVVFIRSPLSMWRRHITGL